MTRLEVGGAFDATEVEGANPTNTPVLRASVPFDPKIDAPITTAEFDVDGLRRVRNVRTAHGSLLPSPTAAPQALYFDLPVSVETVPALALVTGLAALTIALRLSNATGSYV